MSKGNARFSPEQLDSMGLMPDGEGGWKPKKKEEIYSSKDINPDNDISPKPMYTYAENMCIPQERTQPFDIASIRALGSGTKARTASMEHLYLEAKQFVISRKNDIYIKGNTASSKNSKEIGFYYKGSGPDKKKINILMDSKLTKAYRKATARYWIQYKSRFLETIKGKPLPLRIEYTFIRKQLNRFDYINAAQILNDLMVEYKWLPDDDSENIVPVFNPVVYYSNVYHGVIIKVL